MANLATDLARHYDLVTAALRTRGLLLAAYDAQGRANAMTIGWGSAGVSWGMPIWTVLVRPSRYTYECIERSGAFSVCVPPPDLAHACGICGTRSGRDTDKLTELGLTVARGASAEVPLIGECPIQYECAVVHSNDILPDRLAGTICDAAYAQGDFHRVYWGRVHAVHIAPDAAARLSF